MQHFAGIKYYFPALIEVYDTYKIVEGYIAEKGLAGITLLTNKYAPATHFYRKNGFVDCEHVIFMAKEML